MVPPILRAIFNVASIGFALHFLSSWALRSTLHKKSDVFLELFAQPALNKGPGGPWLLRVKYFIPWVPAPEQFTREAPVVRMLFVGARLGGAMIVISLIALPIAFWYVASRG